jgi:hypothetical protein
VVLDLEDKNRISYRQPMLDWNPPSSCSNWVAKEGGPMRYACIVAALMSAPMVEAKGLQGAKSSTAAYAPYVLYWPQKPGDPRPRQSVGLLYTPELLAALIARHWSESVPTRVSEAVQQQTAIVVMWTIPPNADSEPWERPFSASIVEDGDAFGGRLRIEPLWTLQNADELRELDTRTPFREVGVMAAFPRSAFVAGRLVTIYLRLPSEPGQLRGVQRFGLIEWNGALPKSAG